MSPKHGDAPARTYSKQTWSSAQFPQAAATTLSVHAQLQQEDAVRCLSSVGAPSTRSSKKVPVLDVLAQSYTELRTWLHS
eukprot:1156571-Pelagomonas_calceolata.AAC.2